MCYLGRIKAYNTSFFLNTIFSLVILMPSLGCMDTSNNFHGATNFAYGKDAIQPTHNYKNSVNIQNITAKKVHVGDIDIAFKILGKGDPFLLISGSGLAMDAWEPSLLQDLSKNHTVIIFDNRGVGNTTYGTKPFSIVQFANDTAGLLDALRIQKADVLGFSMASFIAQELTLLHPEKVKKLVLYGAACGGKEGIPQSPDVIKILSDIVNNRQQDPEKILSVTFPLPWVESHPNVTFPQSKEILTSKTLKQQFGVVEDWLAPNWSGVCSQLPKIAIPTLVITGTEDVSVPAANSLIIVQKVPSSWLVQIKGGGHGLMYQYPEQFSRVVKAFLENT